RQLNLLGGEQNDREYRALNPQGLVPMLEIDGHKLTQSLSIIMYLATRFPEPPLLPQDPADAAHVRAMALAIACDIHPLNNLRVLKYLKHEFAQPQERIDGWYAHWITEGLGSLEAAAAPRAGDFLFGDTPSIADVCLVPQLYNARRYDVPLDDYPTLLRADANANRLEAFAAAHPDRQEQPT
ncbi:MAG TPA: maleylacetoacetate isomerase, partial [Sphingomicrobium sp.]